MNRRWRSVAGITAGAAALFAAMRLLPTGTNLEHADFQTGAGFVEMCDPANPQFLPVLEMKSPVSAELKMDDEARAGERVRARMVLRTASGKVIGADDLLVTHTEKLHLLIIDETLGDYQHAHPRFDAEKENWEFEFTPRRGGTYRIFCDFMPAATARGLYASVDLNVMGEVKAGWKPALQNTFSLRGDVAARRQATLVLEAADGAALQPVMGAFAHLVAFDAERGGFAHLHPVEAGKAALPLTFKVTLPRAGVYVVWAQMRIGGEDVFVPFRLDVRG